MAVRDVQTDTAGGVVTFASVGTHTGRRLVVILADRSGGETSEVTTNGTGMGTVPLDVAEVTLPGSATDRRSVYLHSIVIPGTASGSVDVTSTVRDGSNTVVSHAVVAMIVDEGDGFTFGGSSSGDTGSSTAMNVGTGSTAMIDAGDHLVVAAAVSRGDSNISTDRWNNSSSAPDNPADGAWQLSIQTGTTANDLLTSGGYLDATAEPDRTWDDTFNVTPNARMLSALVAVWTTGAAGAVVQGTANLTLGGLSLAATAKRVVHGTASIALGGLNLTAVGQGAVQPYLSIEVGPMREPLEVGTMRDPLQAGVFGGTEPANAGQIRDDTPTVGAIRDDASPVAGVLRVPLGVETMRDPVQVDELRE